MNWVCKWCRKELSRKWNLDRHIKQFHQSEDSLINTKLNEHEMNERISESQNTISDKSYIPTLPDSPNADTPKINQNLNLNISLNNFEENFANIESEYHELFSGPTRIFKTFNPLKDQLNKNNQENKDKPVQKNLIEYKEDLDKIVEKIYPKFLELENLVNSKNPGLQKYLGIVMDKVITDKNPLAAIEQGINDYEKEYKLSRILNYISSFYGTNNETTKLLLLGRLKNSMECGII